MMVFSKGSDDGKVKTQMMVDSDDSKDPDDGKDSDDGKDPGQVKTQMANKMNAVTSFVKSFLSFELQ